MTFDKMECGWLIRMFPLCAFPRFKEFFARKLDHESQIFFTLAMAISKNGSFL